MSHTYEVRSHTERLRNRVFSIVTDEVVMPGGEVVTRDYMVHVGAVGVVALDADGRVALVRQYRPAVRTVLWELPAGLVDVAGEPLAAAAARELAEEADLVAARWDLLAELHPSPGASNEKIRLFLAREIATVPEAERHERTHEEAELELHWIDLDEAVGMALAGEITNAAAACGVLAAARARDRGWSTLRPASAAT
ncbi:NUDIX domain-containing protein [Dactylosporangium sucinum]|uniref:NUDIX hydrolase n=1 Tax=Dactylosporangium sucinum TaxID=1424081 RepID=A0A917T1H7_9ACTN|nr:NUDIX hydrolase [Dactylosporangium sucinum]GGM07158.1 NUDIX hydrolase [Dactylosporangium sucinum]